MYINTYLRIRERQKGKQRKSVKNRDWVLHKKEVARTRGKKDVPFDSKYTGRKRRPKF